MALVLDGNGTMTVGNGDITGLATGALPSTVIGAGAVLQVVTAVTNSTYSYSGGTTWTASGFTASITPTSASSKIYVHVAGGQWRYTASGGNEAWSNMYRSIGGGAYSALTGEIQEILISPGTGVMATQHSLAFLDSPNTTSTVTYQPYIRNNTGSATVYWNLGTVFVYITLFEVAA